MDHIIIRGARQHNLKNVDLILPRLQLIVITGVSGSGKSSLAFDTLFAEGQRRYVEALSTHARQFLQNLDAPQVDEIQGLSPAIAIEQKGLSPNPRSTVGTLTEIHDHLRLLYARLGTVYCPVCDLPIRAHTVPQMVQELLADWPEGSRLLILTPLGTIGEKSLLSTFKRLRHEGFARVRLDGEVYELDPFPHVPRRSTYAAEVVVDRVILDRAQKQRLTDSLELALKIGKQHVVLIRLQGGEKRFSELFQCLSCGRQMPELTPSLFSFQHPSGMCPSCKGLGTLDAEDPGAQPLADENQAISHPFGAPCPACRESRLNEAARSVRLEGRAIHEVSALAIPQVRAWLERLPLSAARAAIAERPKQEIMNRLNAMEELGLAYLSLDRAVTTLSGGEAQRIRLAHQLNTSLSGVLYVLDEPSIGLHPRDHQRLLHRLFELRDHGNTVVVVEHDRETILQADYVVDMGPGAGVQGGEVIFAGSPEALLQDSRSLTGAYLSGRKRMPLARHRTPFAQGTLRLVNARGHNLKGITVDFPLACMTCVTGVSGSGKSTLVLDTLYRALAQRLYAAKSPPAPFDTLESAEAIRKVILIDQSPLGRTPRSTPATYTGLFDLIRQLFAQLPEARARGYGSGRFSFNAKGGRCEICKGEGLQRIDMVFLPDVYVTCPACEGSRYNPGTLEIRFKGHSIAEVLDMTVHEALSLFESFPPIRGKLTTLQEVGLGYLRLGQPATTLSGGEAQRVKLAAELSRRTHAATLYVLDEPTTGLHFADVEKLLHVLQRLVDVGHTVIMIEHHPQVMTAADYLIDLGPEGGEEGGRVVATGTPEEVSRVEHSFTGQYVQSILGIDEAG